MKVADYIANFLAEKGVKRVHMIMGGGAMTIQDAFCSHKEMRGIFYHSEAGASYSAFGESKMTNKVSVCSPTTGIAGVNAMAGLLSAWQDSAPVLFISGNVPVAQTTMNAIVDGSSPRQVGIQENNILAMVQSTVKQTFFVWKPENIRNVLERAFELCMTGRKGPVWIDVPADVSNMEIDPDTLDWDGPLQNKEETWRKNKIRATFQKIMESEAPLILAGNGIHTADCREDFEKLIKKYKVPFVTTFLGVDLLPEHRLNIGRIGIKGTRAGNFALQNCDKLLVLGSCLNTSHVGYLPETFAGGSEIFSVDIDSNRTTLVEETVIWSDLVNFFKAIEDNE